LVKFFLKEKGWEKVAEIITEGVMTLDLSIKEVANACGKRPLQVKQRRTLRLKYFPT
jgi:hypothetical protein